MLFFLNEKNDILSSIEVKNQDRSPYLEFSEPRIFSVTSAYESCPVAIEDRSREIYLFWASDFTGDDEIFYYNSSDASDFQTGSIQYGKSLQSIDEEPDQSVKNLTRDPNQNNSSPKGYFCNDISFSVAVINGGLWVIWDSYNWDLRESNNRRQIKYVKMENNRWSQPVTIIDTSVSKKSGRDDRCPAIAQTEDGTIWLFWHSDRYRTENDENFEICYIKSEDGGNSWIWNEPDNFDPFRLTNTSARDMFPSVSVIGKRIFVVWQSDARLGNFDIFYCEFDGEKWLPAKNIIYEDFPEIYPQAASYGNSIIVAWESLKGDNFLAKYKYLMPESEVFQFVPPPNTSIFYPSVSFISQGKLFGKEPWFVWQYYYISGNSSNIWVEDGNGNIFPVTDEFSLKGRSRIIEFGEKIWFFWDSSGGGNGRGIYYKYMYTEEIPLWLSISFFVLVAVLFSYIFHAGSENVQRTARELYESVERYSRTHNMASRFLKYLIGILISVILTYLIPIIFSSLF